jgi:uncharacterized peroxidase-related enzyme
MSPFTVPKFEEVSAKNQGIFKNLEKAVGFVPNIYATLALSENALERYIGFANGATSLNKKEKEVINLVVSQINQCQYCLAAHTAIGKMNGFSDEQILELRKGKASFDQKLDALARLTAEITANRGQDVNQNTLENFFNAGYSQEHLVDLILAVSEKTVTNLLHGVTKIPVDFPQAPSLS